MGDEARWPPTEVFSSFDEAAAHPDGAVVLVGDYGGTTYLTVPASRVRCTERQLTVLLSDLDAITWVGGPDFDARFGYHQVAVTGFVEGGDGGAQVVDGVWTHPDWIDQGVADLARQVVEARRQRLPGRLLRQRRAARLAQRRELRERQPPVPIRGEALPWDFDVVDPVVPFPDDD